jgi:hypothetical protein
MSRVLAMAAVTCLVLYSVADAQADRLGKGRSLLSVGVAGHTGQFISPYGAFYFPYTSSEVGGSLAYSRFLSDQWTVAIAGTFYIGRARLDQNNPNGSPLATETLATHTFQGRVGTDRFAFFDDNIGLFTGPGLFVFQSRAKDEDQVHPPTVGGGTNQGPDATGIGIDWRIGVHARMSGGTAFEAHVGEGLAYAWGKDSNGKVSWWSSNPEGALGLAFSF